MSEDILEKGHPSADFYGDSSSSDEKILADREQQILSLARQYTNEKSAAAHTQNTTDKDSTNLSFSRRLSRASTYSLSGIDSDINPFLEPTDPALDPHSDKFSARAWTRHVVRFKDRDPDLYPHRSLGVSIRNLSAFGYGTGTDYQKNVSNAPLSLLSSIRNLTGHKGEKVQIIRDFDGLLKPGESCVVLGRPGR